MHPPLTRTERKQISLGQQIEEVERELKYRTRVYQHLCQNGKLRPAVAEYQMQRMEAVLQTLRWLETNETEIRAIMAERFAAKDRKRVDDEAAR